MKKINYRIVGLLMAVVATVIVCGGGIWIYYDSGGESGAGVGTDIADIATTIDSSTMPAADDVNDGGIAVVSKKDPGVGAQNETAENGGMVDELDNLSDSVAASSAPTAAGRDEVDSSTVTAPGANQQAAAAIAPPPSQKCTLPTDMSMPPAADPIILNEIAWMGSLPAAGETSSKASNREWIELKNISGVSVDVAGWQIIDAAGNLKIIIESTSTVIAPGGFYLLVRDGQSVVAPPTSGFGAPTVVADAGYTGSLSNAGNKLELVNPSCVLEDFIDASTGWPAGNATAKQTMERDAAGLGWHTSAAPGGTPRAENSTPAAYLVSVSFTGNGAGMVSGGNASATPNAAIACGFTCQANFVEGTKLTLVAAPATGSMFNGWSGACATKSNDPPPTCSFIVSSSVAIAADFEQVPTKSLEPTVQTVVAASSPDNPNGNVTSSTPTSAHLLIATIQIAGASSSNDFVKIFNPSGATVDISGWKLHKKSSTGTDYSLKTLANGSTVAPGGYYEWANSVGGFADSIGAQASSTETLSADNSVALFDANGAIVDQVAWGTGSNQYVEGDAFATDPTTGQVLARKTAAGALVDTDNNAEDFTLE